MRSAFLRVERIVRLLRRLAELTGACVLVTNHATRRDFDEGGDRGHNHRPSLGKLFSGAADERLFVRREEDRRSTFRTVTLEKSAFGVAGKMCRIQIGKGGWESESL